MREEFYLDKSDREILQQVIRIVSAKPWEAQQPRRRSAPPGGSSGGGLRRAQIAEIPEDLDHVKCSLLNQTTGIVATEGNEFEIDVYADICGGARMDRIAPQLVIGKVVWVGKYIYDNDGTPEERWGFITTADSTEDFIGDNP